MCFTFFVFSYEQAVSSIISHNDVTIYGAIVNCKSVTCHCLVHAQGQINDHHATLTGDTRRIFSITCSEQQQRRASVSRI